MKTVTVKLVKKTSTAVDPFGNPINTEEIIDVPGCLVGQPSSDQLAETLSMYGKHISFVVGIPKEDTNEWIDTDVIIFGDRYRTIGYPETGIQENIPLKWGKNIKVERYG